MTVGFVMLVHTAFDRAEQVARYWADHDCPVVIHVDGGVGRRVYQRFRTRLADVPLVQFSDRVKVRWGTWSLVEATQKAASQLLAAFPDLRHVFLASGSCLPLRPAPELKAYLEGHPETDFIESVTIDEVTWTIDGLEAERFTLHFPFSWREQRKLFDTYTTLQRRLGIKRRVPEAVQPHLGSQWWCLTRQTLEAILNAPDRSKMEAYFRKVWIPDECYFQSLARRYSKKIESRSLTLAKFDVYGRPHIFYDDHMELLERSDCFVARKIWHHADRLYNTFLSDGRPADRRSEPNPGKIDRVFSRANERRLQGRPGLYSQARFPARGVNRDLTCARYNVFCGFDDLFEEFQDWLARRIGGRVHGHLYHPKKAEFAGGETVLNGCLSNSAALRDYRPEQFLTNLLWSTRGERQTFMLGPQDQQDVINLLARDPNATIAVVTGAWAVRLSRSETPFQDARSEAAKLQRTELAFLDQLKAPSTRARVHRWTLADFVTQPMEKLQNVLDEITGPGPRRLTEVPQMHDLSALQDFLGRLRNEGMKPVVTGDFAVQPTQIPTTTERPRVVR